MRSKAAIGDHPIHPALAPIPIGAFVLALIGDLATIATGEFFWYRFAYYCIGIGVLTALLAAIFGLIDYVWAPMTRRVRTLATAHMVLNLIAILLYTVDWLLRRNDAAYRSSGWTGVVTLATVALVFLGVSGWIGGQLAYVHRVGVVEEPDRPAEDSGTRRVA